MKHKKLFLISNPSFTKVKAYFFLYEKRLKQKQTFYFSLKNNFINILTLAEREVLK
ncbi:hypothetical protein HMPREF9078_01108 [Capnocytophaga sp. oral taxon 380 str. F0488]|nr:hypothetical protein HMPREF9078_01108 [Capnocytophaga sp. oral taxon 380 str. F0488]